MNNKNSRIKYLDLLKGFAIFLMVMGHFLAWSLPTGYNYTDLFVWNLIYSFHMPLFFFISGFLVDISQKPWTKTRSLNLLFKRFRTLIIPGIIFYFIDLGIAGSAQYQWFLSALFWIYVFFLLINTLVQKIKKTSIQICIHALFFIILFAINKVCDNEALDWLGIKNAIGNYPYFVLGYYICKTSTNRYFETNNLVYSLSLIFFCILLAIRYMKYGNIDIHYPFLFYCLKYPLAICGIITCWKIASDLQPNNYGPISNYFCTLGKISLAVLLLSNKLIPAFPDLGYLFIEGFPNRHRYTTVFVQMTSGIAISTIVCTISIYIKRIIEKSKLLNMLMFGELAKK